MTARSVGEAFDVVIALYPGWGVHDDGLLRDAAAELRAGLDRGEAPRITGNSELDARLVSLFCEAVLGE